MSKNVEIFSCEYCDKTFARKFNLQRHLKVCSAKQENDIKENIKAIKKTHRKETRELKDENLRTVKKTKELKLKVKELEKTIQEKNKELKEKDEEITELKVKCESGKIEVYDKVCNKALDKSTVTNTYIHPKLVNLPITTIQPLTTNYVKEQVNDGNYTFDHYLKGPDGLADFIYSITMCKNDDGETERNFVCTDPSRDSYHRLVETKEWRKDKGGKFIDVILDTLSPKADNYHKQLLDERIECKGHDRKKGYDSDSIFKSNNDMHTGIVRSHGPERRTLRTKLKKETSKKISV
jgi:hypothetical protein